MGLSSPIIVIVQRATATEHTRDSLFSTELWLMQHRRRNFDSRVGMHTQMIFLESGSIDSNNQEDNNNDDNGHTNDNNSWESHLVGGFIRLNSMMHQAWTKHSPTKWGIIINQIHRLNQNTRAPPTSPWSHTCGHSIKGPPPLWSPNCHTPSGTNENPVLMTNLPDCWSADQTKRQNGHLCRAVNYSSKTDHFAWLKAAVFPMFLIFASYGLSHWHCANK